MSPVEMHYNRYQKLAISTVIATLVLIFVGGLVRAAGAGLGCPDWPTCFGMWIPPFSAEALPPGYDADLFNPVHTWLEYINRLTGIVIGLLITATFIFSFRYRTTDKAVTVSAGIAFVLVLIQGWLGGRVVQTGLSAGVITLHMLLAMVIVNVLLYTAFRATSERLKLIMSAKARRYLLAGGVILLLFTLIQMVLGTQVREMVDVVKNVSEPPPRAVWLDQLSGWIYPVHRSFSWMVVLATGGLWWMNRIYDAAPPLRKLGQIIIKLLLLQIGAGLGMEWFGMSSALQVIHLVGAALMICAIFLYILMVWFSRPSGARG